MQNGNYMKHHLAIDVGSCYVKVIEGSERNGRLFVSRMGHFPNPFPGLRSSLVEREQDAFVKVLKDFLHKNGMGAKNAVSIISGAGTIIHYFDIPQLSDEEIKSAINLEMMQVTPGGTKNLEYDYLMSPGKNGGKTVFFVGYHKDKCEFFTNTLQRSGLKPLIMDHDALAVFNIFNFLNRKHSGPVFLINAGHKTTNLVLAEGKKDGFILIRDILFGGSNMMESIAGRKGIPREDAEIYCCKKENADEVKAIIASDLEDLLPEITASMEYFKTRTGKSPDNLFLTGGSAAVPGMCESLEQNLKIKTSVWNPIEQMAEMKTSSFPEDVRNRGSSFAVVLGLLLRKIT